MTLRVGLSAYDIAGTELVQLAVAADEAGFESLWLGEHIVLPADYGSEHPTTGDTAHQHHPGPIVDPTTKLLDPLVALAACASVTTHLRLATGIFILPLRHPLLTARMTLTLQELAGGRFVLGVGAGWLEEEFDALDVPFDDRAARMDETLTILRQAWSGDTFAHDGSLFTFGNVQLTPEPVDVPLILGGNTERALRRAATAGDGWFSSGTPSFDDAVRLRDRLVELRDPGGRAASSRSTCAWRTRIKLISPATRQRGSSTCSSGPTSSGPPRATWTTSEQHSPRPPPTSASNDTTDAGAHAVCGQRGASRNLAARAAIAGANE